MAPAPSALSPRRSLRTPARAGAHGSRGGSVIVRIRFTAAPAMTRLPRPVGRDRGWRNRPPTPEMGLVRGRGQEAMTMKRARCVTRSGTATTYRRNPLADFARKTVRDAQSGCSLRSSSSGRPQLCARTLRGMSTVTRRVSSRAGAPPSPRALPSFESGCSRQRESSLERRRAGLPVLMREVGSSRTPSGRRPGDRPGRRAGSRRGVCCRGFLVVVSRTW
jgi:hypothetical protein